MVLSVFIAGCQKEKADDNQITGKWELRSRSGVQVPGLPSSYAPSNGNIIEFTGDDYQKVENGTVVHKGKYEIMNASTTIDGNTYAKAFIIEKSDLKYFFKITDKKLVLSIGSIASDGYTAVYEKL